MGYGTGYYHNFKSSKPHTHKKTWESDHLFAIPLRPVPQPVPPRRRWRRAPAYRRRTVLSACRAAPPPPPMGRAPGYAEGRAGLPPGLPAPAPGRPWGGSARRAAADPPTCRPARSCGVANRQKLRPHMYNPNLHEEPKRRQFSSSPFFYFTSQNLPREVEKIGTNYVVKQSDHNFHFVH